MRLAALSLPVAEKRALAGKFAGRMNRANSDRRLMEAIAALEQEGMKMTQAAIAARANLSERTVRSRWALLMGGHLRDSVDAVAASPQATPGTFRRGSLAEFHVPQLAEAPD